MVFDSFLVFCVIASLRLCVKESSLDTRRPTSSLSATHLVSLLALAAVAIIADIALL